MKITIIGWYGTETLGDRAILSGIITVLSNIYGDIHIRLGSLFPFFSERTILEDYELWGKLSGKKIKTEVFDSKIPKKLSLAIKNSDILVMGGGPLMHIQEMHLIDYAFKKAKKLNKKTIIFGCGIGPIYDEKYHKVLISIMENTDISFIRDNQSIDTLKKITKGADLLNRKQIFVSHDPAIIPCLYCKEKLVVEKEDFIAVNLRKFPGSYSKSTHQIDELLINFLNDISIQDSSKIKLVPMHYFAAGGDDREYFYHLLSKIDNKSKFEIQNIPLNVAQTLKLFANAKYNVGMRYHSVLFQTVMNGNNYIIDYTEPQKGKISGFLNSIDKNNFYLDRYINLQQNQHINFSFSAEKFVLDISLNDVITNSYSEINNL